MLMQEYNSVSDELRADCEVRADLHQRVDDLRDRLWSIGDERKDQAGARFLANMLLSTVLHCSLMQSLDRHLWMEVTDYEQDQTPSVQGRSYSR